MRIKAAGEKEGFDAGVEESFKLGSSLGKAGISTALDDLIYSLKPGEFSKTPIKVDDKWVIVGVTKRIRCRPDRTCRTARYVEAVDDQRTPGPGV